MAEDIDSEILEPLQLMVREAQKNVNGLKEISKTLKNLQDDFFSELKFIADIVGITMPEPSEIDLLQDAVRNPLQLIEEYKKEKGIKTDPMIVSILKDTFAGIEPVLNKQAGGSEYRNELLDVLKKNCCIKPEDIHINDV